MLLNIAIAFGLAILSLVLLLVANHLMWTGFHAWNCLRFGMQLCPFCGRILGAKSVKEGRWLVPRGSIAFTNGDMVAMPVTIVQCKCVRCNEPVEIVRDERKIFWPSYHVIKGHIAFVTGRPRLTTREKVQ